MEYLPVFGASLLLALFIATKLLGGRSLDRIKARTVGHGQHGSARWATRREIRSYYTMVPYESQKWRSEPETRPSNPGFVLGTFLRTGKYRIRKMIRMPTMSEDRDLESTSIPSVSGSIRKEVLLLFFRKSHRKTAHPKQRNWPYS